MPDTVTKPAVVNPGGAATQPAWTGDRIAEVVRRAGNGDTSALPPLREILSLKPHAADLLGGNLAERSADTLLTAFAGQNLYLRETVAKKMADLRAELAGPNPSAIERLLAERAACCWLHLYHLEAVYAGKGPMALELGTYYQKCIDRAHKRYLSALKALADVRKSGVTVQLNVARKQVNVAGGSVRAAV